MAGLRTLFRKSRLPSRAGHLALGAAGEELAREHLRSQGYRIVATNYSLRLGRGLHGQPITSEIDIVAYDSNVLCFIEVKTRTSNAIAEPERAVTFAKQRKIARAARRYRQLLCVTGEPYRFDVIGIVTGIGRPPEVTLSKNFFLDPLFLKKRFIPCH